MIFSPSRRKLIKQSPLLAAGLLMTGKAWARSRAGASLLSGAASPPSQPWPAYKYGFNRNVFYEDFNNLNGIDVNNTLAPGFNFYVQTNVNAPNNAAKVVPSSAFSVSNSILTFTPPSGVSGDIGTAAYQSPSQAATPGTVFNGAGYFEARIRVNNAGSTGAPAFWMIDDLILSNIGTEGSGGPGACPAFPTGGLSEVDFMEFFGSPIDIDCYNWYSCSSTVRNTNFLPSSQPTTTNFNLYGSLILQPSRNNGTGLIIPYINRVALPECTVTFTSSGISPQAASGAQNGWMNSVITSTGMTIFLTCGGGGSMDIDYVQVWQ